MSDERPDERAVKARILGFALVDIVIDLVLPFLVYLLLHAAGAPTFAALTAGGIVVGAKASLGRLESWRADRTSAGVAAAAVVALVVLFALTAAGAPDVVAAAASGVVIALPVLLSVFGRGRRPDGIGLLILVEIAASTAVVLISDDPRFVLARPAVYTAVAGVYALVSCFAGRPLMLDASKPMAAGGDPVRAQAFENAWTNSAPFRRIERVMTAGLGLVLLAEAVIRVVVVYSSSREDVVDAGIAAQVPAVVLVVGFLVAIRVFAVPRASAVVDEEQKSLVAAGADPA